jgi:hypothetical protein
MAAQAQTTEIEIISVPEWCRRVGCSLDAGYRAARASEIAGLFRIGRLMRINWTAFVAATFGNGDRTAGVITPPSSR